MFTAVMPRFYHWPGAARTGAPHYSPVMRLIPALLLAAATAASAQSAPRSGEAIVRDACMACHGEGLLKAPRLGDRKAWAPLIREGQPALTATAWTGIRQMPPKGGRADLSLEELARAVAYMARQGGDNWPDPDAATLARIEAAVKKREARGAKP